MTAASYSPEFSELEHQHKTELLGFNTSMHFIFCIKLTLDIGLKKLYSN
jgi:hypothetical protein